MPWAIHTDLSGVTQIPDGLFETELEATKALILHLESERSEIAVKIFIAKRRRRHIIRNLRP